VRRDWQSPQLERWSARSGSTPAHAGGGPWIAVAQSFGVLALAHHHLRPDPPVAAALLVAAPADPDKFGLGAALPQQGLPIALTTMALSYGDPVAQPGGRPARGLSLGVSRGGPGRGWSHQGRLGLPQPAICGAMGDTGLAAAGARVAPSACVACRMELRRIAHRGHHPERPVMEARSLTFGSKPQSPPNARAREAR
jgi:Serine hydrolase